MSNIRQYLETRRMITVAVPMPPIASRNAETDTTFHIIYENNIYTHVKRKLKLEEKPTKVYSLFKGQRTKGIKAKLKIHANYVHMEASCGLFLLIRTPEVIKFKFEGHKNQSHAIYDADVDFYYAER